MKDQTKLFPKSEAELAEKACVLARTLCRVAKLKEEAKKEAKERREEIAEIEARAYALAAEIRGEDG